MTPPENLTARGLAQQGWLVISIGEMAYDPGPRDRAANLAQQALALDPTSGLAQRVLAWVAWWNVYHATTASIPETLASGIDAATQAIAADPTRSGAWVAFGRLGLCTFRGAQLDSRRRSVRGRLGRGRSDCRIGHNINLINNQIDVSGRCDGRPENSKQSDR